MYDFTSAQETVNLIAQQTQTVIMDQLNELIKRDLLVIITEQPQLVQKHDGGLDILQSVKLELKDQKYIEKLETENRELKSRLNLYREAMKEARDFNEE